MSMSVYAPVRKAGGEPPLVLSLSTSSLQSQVDHQRSRYPQPAPQPPPLPLRFRVKVQTWGQTAQLEAGLDDLLAGCPCASYFLSLCLGFPIL